MLSSKLWTKDFCIILVINFIIYLSHVMLLVTFPFYIDSMNGAEWISGTLQALFSVVAILSRPIVGWLLDNGKRKGILLIGLLGIAVLPMGYAALPIMTFVIVFRLLNGMALSFSSTAAATITTDHIPPNRLSDGMGAFALSIALATCLAPTVALYLLNAYGYTTVFRCVTFGTVGSLILLAFLKAPNVNVIKKPMNVKALLEYDAIPATVTFMAFLITFGALENFLAKYVAYKGTLPSATLYFASLAVAFLLSRIFLSKVSERKGEGIFVYTGNAAMFAALLLLAVIPNPATFFLSAALVGYAIGVIQPALQTMAIRGAQPQRRGAANSTFLCGYDAGMGLGAVTAGFLISALGYESMFGLVIIANVISIIIYKGGLSWQKTFKRGSQS